MTTVRAAKPKVETAEIFKKNFLQRHAEVYYGWLSEQRASVAKAELKAHSETVSRKRKSDK